MWCSRRRERLRFDWTWEGNSGTLWLTGLCLPLRCYDHYFEHFAHCSLGSASRRYTSPSQAYLQSTYKYMNSMIPFFIPWLPEADKEISPGMNRALMVGPSWITATLKMTKLTCRYLTGNKPITTIPRTPQASVDKSQHTNNALVPKPRPLT